MYEDEDLLAEFEAELWWKLNRSSRASKRFRFWLQRQILFLLMCS